MDTNQKKKASRRIDIDWIAYQLANDHGIEMTATELWYRLYLDAGCSELVASQMAEELCENRDALAAFAQHHSQGHSPRFEAVPEHQLTSTFESWAIAGLAAAAGFLAGVML